MNYWEALNILWEKRVDELQEELIQSKTRKKDKCELGIKIYRKTSKILERFYNQLEKKSSATIHYEEYKGVENLSAFLRHPM